jgi:hypothetical protein
MRRGLDAPGRAGGIRPRRAVTGDRNPPRRRDRTEEGKE